LSGTALQVYVAEKPQCIEEPSGKTAEIYQDFCIENGFIKGKQEFTPKSDKEVPRLPGWRAKRTGMFRVTAVNFGLAL
jgi:hypothetical protein